MGQCRLKESDAGLTDAETDRSGGALTVDSPEHFSGPGSAFSILMKLARVGQFARPRKLPTESPNSEGLNDLVAPQPIRPGVDNLL